MDISQQGRKTTRNSGFLMGNRVRGKKGQLSEVVSDCKAHPRNVEQCRVNGSVEGCQCHEEENTMMKWKHFQSAYLQLCPCHGTNSSLEAVLVQESPWTIINLLPFLNSTLEWYLYLAGLQSRASVWLCTEWQAKLGKGELLVCAWCCSVLLTFLFVSSP